LSGQMLRRDIEIVHVVVDEVKEVADLVISCRLGERVRTSELVVETGKLLAVAPVRLVAADQRMGEARSVLHYELQFLEARRVTLEQRIGHHLRKRRKQPVAVSSRDRPDIDLKLLRERQKHGGRDRALVVFDLIEIARGNAEPFGKGRLCRLAS